MDDFFDVYNTPVDDFDMLDMEVMPEQSTEIITNEEPEENDDNKHIVKETEKEQTEEEKSEPEEDKDEVIFENDREIYTRRDFELLDKKEKFRVTRLMLEQMSDGMESEPEALAEPEPEPVSKPALRATPTTNIEVPMATDESTGMVTKEIKIERTAAVIAARSDAVTLPNAFGELDTYVARRQQKDGDVVYWEQAYRTELEHMVYRSMLSPDIVHMAKCRLPATASNARAVTDTVLHATYNSDMKCTNNTIMLSSKLINDRGCEMPAIYYDINKGEIMYYDELDEEEQGKCFRRFCNTTSDVLHVPRIKEEEVNLDLVIKHAKIAKKQMHDYYIALGNRRDESELLSAYDVRFPDTFGTWACGDIGLYVDILTMFATPLMKRKPEYTFFILGRAANGKSSARHLIQTIYGARNCADVQVSQMGSWDYAATLLNKIVNFPDEEKTSIEEMDKATFKSMSTHENIHIRKKGSSIPFDIKCDFISIIPLNELPRWRNLDSGVARRIKIIPFNADLTKESNNCSIDFEEETYTPEFVSRVIGELIGIASFYTTTKLPILWSPTTEKTSNTWKDEYDNTRLFKRDFDRVYSGFTSMNLLYECYMKWCKGGRGSIDVGIDYVYDTKKRLSETFKHFGGYSRRTCVVLDKDHRITCICDDRPIVPQAMLHEGSLIDVGYAGGMPPGKKLATARECLDNGCDPITMRLLSVNLKRTDEMDTKDSTVINELADAKVGTLLSKEGESDGEGDVEGDVEGNNGE